MEAVASGKRRHITAKDSRSPIGLPHCQDDTKGRAMADYIFSKDTVDQMRRHPMHEVLRDLGKAGHDGHRLGTHEFKKLLGYLTEIADGRDRREPLTDVPGTHRPQPKLRVLLDAAFGELGDLTWFRMNKVANQSRLPLKGMFTRMAASIGRLKEEHLEEVLEAIVSESPDRKLLKLLNQTGGKIPHCGLDLFSKLAYLFRPDLYFLVPKRWGDESGCLKFINNDLRKYCAICRTLRTICDEVGFPDDIRGTVFNLAVEMDPVHPTLENAINNSIGGALAWANVLEPGEAYVGGKREDDEISMPLETASLALRVRRGDMRLRNQLIRAYRSECAISGKCVRDLIEVAYIAPYPAGDVHSNRNAIPLRADLHTIWDLHLIAVHPETMEVYLSERMRGTYYESFAGTTIASSRDSTQLDRVALKERWSHFVTEEKATGAATPMRTTPKAASPAAPSHPANVEPPDAVPAIEPEPDAHEEPAATEVEVFAEIEPKRSPAAGIWRAGSPQSAPASAFGAIGYDVDES